MNIKEFYEQSPKIQLEYLQEDILNIANKDIPTDCFNKMVEWRYRIGMVIAKLEKKEPTNDNIEILDFPLIIYNALKRGGINTISEILSKTDEELLSIRNLNVKRLEILKEILENYKNR